MTRPQRGWWPVRVQDPPLTERPSRLFPATQPTETSRYVPTTNKWAQLAAPITWWVSFIVGNLGSLKRHLIFCQHRNARSKSSMKSRLLNKTGDFNHVKKTHILNISLLAFRYVVTSHKCTQMIITPYLGTAKSKSSTNTTV